ncbi:hypothetical protein [Sphingobacterium daejeonense]|uniref:hypothetical protein n=1 Tax=Sphingobacterium daejeonense TaxID=371142 RepID=UPI003D31EB21
MVTSTLFGSGVSYISGIPGVGTITEKVFSGENVGRQADSTYYISGGQPYLQHHVIDNLKLIDFIKSDIDKFYSHLNRTHYTNYEDIYYVLRQVKDSFNFEFENPAVNSLLLRLYETGEFSMERLPIIVEEAVKYIECVVWQMIAWKKYSSDQFAIIPELIEQLNLRNIISLNHDLALDQFLIQNQVSFCDGFELKNHKFPEWSGIPSETEHIRFLKLHGSVDWFEVGLESPYRYNEIFKLPTNIYVERIRDHDESLWGVTNGTPKLLIGTFNKMLGYLSDVFEILYDSFKERLKETNILIVSGYGFADKGINTQLSYWLNNDHAMKMVIIHPYIEDLLGNARGNFHLNIFNGNNKHSKVEIINKKFEEVTMSEIQEVINK